jgi:hypothetical protein
LGITRGTLNTFAELASCPLERALRDIQAASHPVAITPSNCAAPGRIGLGLEPEPARI